MIKRGCLTFAAVFCLISCTAKTGNLSESPGIVIENARMRLVIGHDGQALSLIHKQSGQECLEKGTRTPAFSVTQYRPDMSELRFKYPAITRTYAADSVYRDGDKLVVGFELINILAVLKLNITDDYIGLTLDGFDHYVPEVPMYDDPLKTFVDEVVLLQLPVRDRKNFGEWLNVMWDDDVAVNLLGTDQYARVFSVAHDSYRVLRAEAVSEIQSEETGAALIVAGRQDLLDCIDRIERDFNLPRGVESRRSEEYKYSYYELGDFWPPSIETIDEHIAFAGQAGFRAIQLDWRDFAETQGHFPWRPEFPNGMEDLKTVIRKINDAGMIAGAHFWYSKATKTDLYVSPVPDHRLNLSRTFTLASALDEKSATVFVEENPRGCTLDNNRRILMIGRELIEYTGYTDEWPYRFTGCTRGVLNTRPDAYPRGFRFGVLDVDTWPIWVRFDQRTSIQREIAERIGDIYNQAGFRFVYFDGAEDVPCPEWYNVGLSQLTVLDHLQPTPLFAEGARRTHFNWHILTRGNAFDVYSPEVIKDAIRAHPFEEAEIVARDFGAINFGWINYTAPDDNTIGLQPDMLEYACSRASAWDCPISLIGRLHHLRSHPRTADNLEVIRRWEDARISGVFSEEQKRAMRNPDQEHILLIDEKGDYELQPYERIPEVAGGDSRIQAYVFDRSGKVYVVYWHTSGESRLALGLNPETTRLFRTLGEEMPIIRSDSGIVITVGDRNYLTTDLTREEVIAAFGDSETLQ